MKVEKVLTGIFDDGVLVAITDGYAAIGKNVDVPEGGFVVEGASVAAPVAVTGEPVVGGVLTATLGHGYSATGYQWQADGEDISLATDATYTVLVGDVGKAITVNVTGLGFASAGKTAVAAE